VCVCVCVCVCRYVAVTHPIQYAKHKNSRRTYLMLAMTWFVSIAVSLPIAVGMNYTERRAATPTLCTFYNADFIIYSSMTSFYIPSFIIVLLYWRIFRAIRNRAQRRTAAATAAVATTSGPRPRQRQLPDIYVVDNHVNAISVSGGATERPEAEISARENATGGGSIAETALCVDRGQQLMMSSSETELRNVAVSGTELPARTDASAGMAADCVGSGSSGQNSSTAGACRDAAGTTQGANTITTVTPTQQPTNCQSTTSSTRHATSDARIRKRWRPTLSRLSRSAIRNDPATTHSLANDKAQHTSRDKNASRRERKATKTLAIVLGTSRSTHTALLSIVLFLIIISTVIPSRKIT